MDQEFDIECPECQSKLRVSLEDVAKQRTVRCPQGHSIKLVDEGGGFRKAEKSLSDLDKAIRKLGS